MIALLAAATTWPDVAATLGLGVAFLGFMYFAQR